MKSHESFDNSAQLDWLAFRYVAGEMTDHESADWERRLADDQTAREAVAGAVQLVQAIGQLPRDTWTTPAVLPASSAPAMPSTTHGGGSRHSVLGWSLAGLALLLVAGLVVSQALRSDRSRLTREGGVDDDLVAAWSQVRTLSTGDVHGGVDAASGDAEEWSAGGESESERAVGSTPSWMLAGMAALIAEHDDADEKLNPATPQDL
jgi:anti-sigma-K factor RskA